MYQNIIKFFKIYSDFEIVRSYLEVKFALTLNFPNSCLKIPLLFPLYMEAAL